MSMTLQTQRLVLRRLEPGDWQPFRDFMASDRSAAVGGPRTLHSSWRQFASELGHWEIFGYGMWAVTWRGDNDCVALIGPWTPLDWPENEIGWMVLDAAAEGTGMATEAATAAIRHAWDALGWTTMVSYIDPSNTRSIRLAEKLGATRDADAAIPEAYPGAHVYRHPKPRGAA